VNKKKAFKAVLLVVLCILALPILFVLVMAPFNSRTPSPTDLATSRLLSSPPPPLAKEITVKVVTFNIQNLPVIARNHVDRMRAIGETLRGLDPDLVGIQEGFVEKHRKVLVDALQGSRLVHNRYFPSATLGSGLFVLSAFPIKEAFFHRYTASGPWYKVYEGDWWAGKGVSLVRVELPSGEGYIDFYNTHMQAKYGDGGYAAVRLAQMTELLAFISRSTLNSVPAILAGDFNSRPGTEVYEFALDSGQLTRMMSIDTRIDHIFAVRNPKYSFEVLETHPIDRKIPVSGGETRLSDHTGYLSTIRIRPTGGA